MSKAVPSGNRDVLDAGVAKSALGGPSFSQANRVGRAIWIVAWTILASWTPPPLHPWRRLLLRLFGAKVHATARIYGSARIWSPRLLTLGRHVVVGPDAIIYCMDRIVIEDHAVISQRAHLCCGSHDLRSSHFQLITRPIRIGEHAWIAAEAFVGPGVTVGPGAVLSARGCAFADLEAWTVYRGNPATPLKQRSPGPHVSRIEAEQA